MGAEETKVCKCCGLEKPLSEFPFRKDRGRYRNTCKQCTNEQKNKTPHRQPEARKEEYMKAGRDRYYLGAYGITAEEADNMKSQGCEVCGSTDLELLRIDHDHDTGEVRGCLCHGCNTAIGHAKENLDILEGLILYLKERKGGIKS